MTEGEKLLAQCGYRDCQRPADDVYKYRTNDESLEPCPWCGEQPQEHYLQPVNYYYIKCDNYDCPANPSVIGLTKNEAAERWNKRAEKTGTIEYQEFEDLCLNGNPITYQLCSWVVEDANI